jgi:RHS repeat-associated protein
VYYYSSDMIHSEVVVTDQNRNVVERTHYAPYGQVLNRALRDGPGYTGHEEDPATGLVYMQQRYYDPQSGRFLSVDPVGVDTTGGGNFNRYWYANDNPYRYTDPDGRQCASSSKEHCHNDAQPCTGSHLGRCDSEELTTYQVGKPSVSEAKAAAAAIAARIATTVEVAAEKGSSRAIPWFGPIVVGLELVLMPGNLAPSDCGDGRCGVMYSRGRSRGRGGRSKGERGRTRSPSGTNRPDKHWKPDPDRPGWGWQRDKDGHKIYKPKPPYIP